jgi:hypothetical protein
MEKLAIRDHDLRLDPHHEGQEGVMKRMIDVLFDLPDLIVRPNHEDVILKKDH